MPKFYHEPPLDEIQPTLTLLRVPATTPLTALVVSRLPIYAATHYVGGRTIPCDGIDCTHCEANRERRWYGWAGIWNPRTRKVAILEFPGRAQLEMQAFLELHHTIRGAKITAQRRPRKPNGRVQIVLEATGMAESELPQAPDVEQALIKIWSGKRRSKPGVDREPSPQELQGILEKRRQHGTNGEALDDSTGLATER